jgi:hypothetical protein
MDRRDEFYIDNVTLLKSVLYWLTITGTALQEALQDAKGQKLVILKKINID